MLALLRHTVVHHVEAVGVRQLAEERSHPRLLLVQLCLQNGFGGEEFPFPGGVALTYGYSSFGSQPGCHPGTAPGEVPGCPNTSLANRAVLNREKSVSSPNVEKETNAHAPRKVFGQ